MTSRTGGVVRSLSKWLLIVLVVANIAVWSAWPFRDELVARGILLPPPVERVDLDPRALPPIVERAATTPATPAGDRGDVPQPVDPHGNGETEDDDGSTDPAGVDAPSQTTPGVAAETPPAQPTSTALLDCVVAGPVASLEAAETMATQLRSTGALVDPPEAAGGAPRYLVYLPPAASRNAATSVLRELEARSIRDVEILRSGPFENAVAVGAYSNRDLADARRDQVAALGYDVLVRDRRRTAYQLRVRQVSADALGDLAHEPCGDDED